MPRYVALLRAVNVGGKNKIPMAELAKLAGSLGYTGISTYIQSGNLLFTAGSPVRPDEIEEAISRAFGFDVPVVLRTSKEIRSVLAANPFTERDPSRLHVGFCVKAPSVGAVKEIDRASFSPEVFAVRGREVYLHLPDGVGRAKLPSYLDRKLGTPMTLRNWNTVTKLSELAD